MSTIAVSSFSLHSKLGPWHIDYRDQDGAVQTYVLPREAEHTLEEFVREVRARFGVSAVELCQLQFADAGSERIDSLRAALEAAGVSVLTMPIDIGDLSGTSPDYRDDDVDRIVQWLDVAQALGAKFARVNTGRPQDEVPGGVDVAGLVDALQQLAGAARERGLRLLIENHGGASSDPEYLLAVQDAVGVENVGILLDLGNFEPVNLISGARMRREIVDEYSIDTEPVYERIAKLAPAASLVHAKAYDARSDGTPLLDLDRALSIVAESGYDGSITVEWEGLEGDPWVHTGHLLDAVTRAFPNLDGASRVATR